MAGNPFDQFDQGDDAVNPFDQFESSDDNRHMPPAKDKIDPLSAMRHTIPQPESQPFAKAEKTGLPMVWSVRLGQGEYGPTVRAVRDDKAGGYVFQDERDPTKWNLVVRRADGSLTSKPIGLYSPTEGMGAGEKFAAAVGGAVTGTGMRLEQLADPLATRFADTRVGQAVDRMGQRMGMPSAKDASATIQANIDDTRKLNAPLMDTAAGFAGDVVGNMLVAGAAGKALNAIPGAASAGKALSTANPAAYAAAQGAGIGLLQPVGSDESTAGNVTAGAFGGLAGYGLSKALTGAIDLAKSAIKSGATKEQAATIVNNALAKNGINRQDIPKNVADAFDAEVRKAINIGGVVDEAALSRKAAYSALGAQPTLGKITRDPQQWAAEHTLAGLEGAGKPLAGIDAANRQLFIDKLNNAGARNSNLTFEKGGDYAAGQAVHAPLSGMVDAARSRISQLYQAAEDMNGRPIDMDHTFFTQRAGDLVDKTGRNVYVPKEIKRILNDIAQGKTPLTIGTAEQLKSILADESRSATNGNVRMAVGAVRQALEETPMLGSKAPGNALAVPGSTGATPYGQDVVEAFRAARKANRELMALRESNPAIRDVMDGIEPDAFFRKHVVGAKVDSLKQVAGFLKQDPQAFAQVRNDILGYLKTKALSGATDETGRFSQSAFNKAMNAFGREKLAAFFSPKEVNELRLLGRVSALEMAAPAASRVNNSNTAAQMANLASKAAKSNTASELMRRAASGVKNSRDVSAAVRANVPVTVTKGALFGQEVLPAAGASALLEFMK